MAAIPFLAAAAPILIATRERHDGQGYPLGLSGGAIPLGARVIAVAEAFDMLSAGPVSSALSINAANAELVRGPDRCSTRP